jgi:uncharacterized damage-inducible protein DinB
MNQILEYTNYIMDGPTSVLMKMIEKVPDEKVQFKPNEASLSIAELVCHILSVMQIHIHAIAEGKGKEEHAQRIPIEPGRISSTNDLVEHCKKVHDSIKKVLQTITDDVLDLEIQYTQWNNYTTLAGIALLYIVEEFFHHRGQLSIYLRLLELQPPQLYKY